MRPLLFLVLEGKAYYGLGFRVLGIEDVGLLGFLGLLGFWA